MLDIQETDRQRGIILKCDRYSKRKRAMRVSQKDKITDRQTDTHTHTQKHRQTGEKIWKRDKETVYACERQTEDRQRDSVMFVFVCVCVCVCVCACALNTLTDRERVD